MLESACGFSCTCVACELSTPFGIVSERRRVVAAGRREGFQNMQEEVEAMEDAFEKLNDPGTAVILGYIEHRDRKSE